VVGNVQQNKKCRFSQKLLEKSVTYDFSKMTVLALKNLDATLNFNVNVVGRDESFIFLYLWIPPPVCLPPPCIPISS
jgi:hypothetical protein